MENNVIDDIPGQGYLFGPDPDKEEPDQDGLDPGFWMDDMLDGQVVRRTTLGSMCNPEKCSEDCDKCTILDKPLKG